MIDRTGGALGNSVANPHRRVHTRDEDVNTVKRFVDVFLYHKTKKSVPIALIFAVPDDNDPTVLGYTRFTSVRGSFTRLCVTVKPGLQLHEFMGVYAHKVAALLIEDIDDVFSEDAAQQHRNYVGYYQFAYDVVNAWNPPLAQLHFHLGMLQAAQRRRVVM